MTLTANTVAELIQYAACRADEDDIILLGGSTVAGLGQASSDYDLYVIRLGGEGGWSEIPVIAPNTSLDALVELEIFAASAVRAQAMRMRAISEGDERTLRREVSQETLVRYSALVTAQPLRDRAGAWHGLLADLDRDLYQRLTYGWHQAWCNELRQLADFFAYIGDLEAAEVACRAAAAHAFDALLMSCGELYFSPKYRFEKAARHRATAELVDALWTLSAPPRRISAAAVKERGALAERFAVAAGGCAMDNGVVVVPARARDARLRQLGGEVLVLRGTRCLVVDDEIAAIWQSVAEEIAWPEFRLRHPDMKVSQLKACLRYLCAQDLLDLPAKLGRWAMWV